MRLFLQIALILAAVADNSTYLGFGTNSDLKVVGRTAFTCQIGADCYAQFKQSANVSNVMYVCFAVSNSDCNLTGDIMFEMYDSFGIDVNWTILDGTDLFDLDFISTMNVQCQNFIKIEELSYWCISETI
jgi:hypothetical protein